MFAVGLYVYIAVVRRAIRMMIAMLGGGEQARRTQWKIAMTTYLVGGVSALLVSLFNPLGIAITLMYKGVRWRRWALPAAFLVALAEHAAVNGLLLTSGSPRWAKLLAAATLHGWLSIVLFIGGSTAIVVYEWRNATRRAQRGSGQPPAWLILSRSEIGRRGAALASLQLTGSKTRPAPNTGGQR